MRRVLPCFSACGVCLHFQIEILVDDGNLYLEPSEPNNHAERRPEANNGVQDPQLQDESRPVVKSEYQSRFYRHGTTEGLQGVCSIILELHGEMASTLITDGTESEAPLCVGFSSLVLQ